MGRFFLLTVIVVCIAGCNAVDSRSDVFDCTGTVDCMAPRVCQNGLCIVPGAMTDADLEAPDANLNVPDSMPRPDADPNAPDAGGATCTNCLSGPCFDACTTACNYDCLSCDCEFDCTAATGLCFSKCQGSANCDVNCVGALDCDTKCEGSSSCETDCTGATSCDVVCEGMSDCLVSCQGAAACNISFCEPGNQMSCPNNVIVCNRACP